MKLFNTLEQRIRLYHQTYMRNQLDHLYKLKFTLDSKHTDKINKEIERIEQKLTASYKKNKL